MLWVLFVLVDKYLISKIDHAAATLFKSSRAAAFAGNKRERERERDVRYSFFLT